MRRLRERGEGRLGGLILLVVLVAVGLAAWHVIPVYYDHYDFVDKVNEICRTPEVPDPQRRRGHQEDADGRGVEAAPARSGSARRASTIRTTDHNRTIRLYYERETEVLPGFKKTFKFDFTADQPLI